MGLAPHIPNLVETLRASKTAQGRKGRRRDLPDDTKDTVVQHTDDDASGSRSSAVEVGYLDDPFAHVFISSPVSVRRMPIINRGTYVRTTAIDLLVDQFLAAYTDQPKQIISLGAGTDTRFFRLLRTHPSLASTLKYHELDFPATTAKKISAIERTPQLLSLLRSAKAIDDSSSTDNLLTISPDKTTLTSPSYNIHAYDLRSFTSQPPALLSHIFATKTPTLLLSEMCLTYLPAATSTALLTHITNVHVPNPAPFYVILYEPLHPNDAFGQTMVRNLSARRIALPGLEAYPTMEAQRERLRQVGFTGGQKGVSMKDVWDGWVSWREKERLMVLEGLDEEEEWVLLAGHYGVVWAWRGEAGLEGGG